MNYVIRDEHRAAFEDMDAHINRLFAEKGKENVTNQDLQDTLFRLGEAIGQQELALFLEDYNACHEADLALTPQGVACPP